MTITQPTTYGMRVEPRTAGRSVVAGPELSPAGNLVLRVGNVRGDGCSWTQTEHVVLAPEEARPFLGDALVLVGATPGRGYGHASDGTVALEAVRHLCRVVDNESEGPIGDLYDVAQRLISAFHDLDNWMENGGELPYAWQPETPPQVITDRAVQASPPAPSADDVLDTMAAVLRDPRLGGADMVARIAELISGTGRPVEPGDYDIDASLHRLRDGSWVLTAAGRQLVTIVDARGTLDLDEPMCVVWDRAGEPVIERELAGLGDATPLPADLEERDQ